MGYSLKMSTITTRSGSVPSALGMKEIGGTKCRGHAGVDAASARLAALNEESLANVVVERQPAIDASHQHQAAELVGADHAIAGLQSGANLVDAVDVESSAARLRAASERRH